MNFTGQIAVVTGAARGIGRATAHIFAQRGAKLALIDVDLEKLETVKEELSEYTKDVLIYKCDISDMEAVNSTFSDILENYGKVDILINNAALFRDYMPFMESTPDRWKLYFDVNVMGTLYCTRCVIPSMLENGYGRIVNIGSVAGVYGNRFMTHYSGTKGAVIAMTSSLAKEYAQSGITVNCVSPGSVSPSAHDDVNYVEPTDLAFMSRTGSDRENAELIAFVASKEASYISGQNIQIDGCRKLL